jgi:hypothetical protein
LQLKHELDFQARVARDQRKILSRASGKRRRQVMEPDPEGVRNSLKTL